MNRDLFINICLYGDTGTMSHALHARTSLDNPEGPKLHEEPITQDEMRRVLLGVDSFREYLIQVLHKQEVTIQKEIEKIIEPQEVKSSDNKSVDSEAC